MERIKDEQYTCQEVGHTVTDPFAKNIKCENLIEDQLLGIDDDFIDTEESEIDEHLIEDLLKMDSDEDVSFHDDEDETDKSIDRVYRDSFLSLEDKHEDYDEQMNNFDSIKSTFVKEDFFVQSVILQNAAEKVMKPSEVECGAASDKVSLKDSFHQNRFDVRPEIIRTQDSLHQNSLEVRPEITSFQNSLHQNNLEVRPEITSFQNSLHQNNLEVRPEITSFQNSLHQNNLDVRPEIIRTQDSLHQNILDFRPEITRTQDSLHQNSLHVRPEITRTQDSLHQNILDFRPEITRTQDSLHQNSLDIRPEITRIQYTVNAMQRSNIHHNSLYNGSPASGKKMSVIDTPENTSYKKDFEEKCASSNEHLAKIGNLKTKPEPGPDPALREMTLIKTTPRNSVVSVPEEVKSTYTSVKEAMMNVHIEDNLKTKPEPEPDPALREMTLIKTTPRNSVVSVPEEVKSTYTSVKEAMMNVHIEDNLKTKPEPEPDPALREMTLIKTTPRNSVVSVPEEVKSTYTSVKEAMMNVHIEDNLKAKSDPEPLQASDQMSLIKTTHRQSVVSLPEKVQSTCTSVKGTLVKLHIKDLKSKPVPTKVCSSANQVLVKENLGTRFVEKQNLQEMDSSNQESLPALNLDRRVMVNSESEETPICSSNQKSFISKHTDVSSQENLVKRNIESQLVIKPETPCTNDTNDTNQKSVVTENHGFSLLKTDTKDTNNLNRDSLTRVVQESNTLLKTDTKDTNNLNRDSLTRVVQESNILLKSDTEDTNNLNRDSLTSVVQVSNTLVVKSHGLDTSCQESFVHANLDVDFKTELTVEHLSDSSEQSFDSVNLGNSLTAKSDLNKTSDHIDMTRVVLGDTAVKKAEPFALNSPSQESKVTATSNNILNIRANPGKVLQNTQILPITTKYALMKEFSQIESVSCQEKESGVDNDFKKVLRNDSSKTISGIHPVTGCSTLADQQQSHFSGEANFEIDRNKLSFNQLGLNDRVRGRKSIIFRGSIVTVKSSLKHDLLKKRNCIEDQKSFEVSNKSTNSVESIVSRTENSHEYSSMHTEMANVNYFPSFEQNPIIFMENNDQSINRAPSVCSVPNLLDKDPSVCSIPNLLDKDPSVCSVPNLLDKDPSVCSVPNLLDKDPSVCSVPNVLEKASNSKFEDISDDEFVPYQEEDKVSTEPASRSNCSVLTKVISISEYEDISDDDLVPEEEQCKIYAGLNNHQSCSVSTSIISNQDFKDILQGELSPGERNYKLDGGASQYNEQSINHEHSPEQMSTESDLSLNKKEATSLDSLSAFGKQQNSEGRVSGEEVWSFQKVQQTVSKIMQRTHFPCTLPTSPLLESRRRGKSLGLKEKLCSEESRVRKCRAPGHAVRDNSDGHSMDANNRRLKRTFSAVDSTTDGSSVEKAMPRKRAKHSQSSDTSIQTNEAFRQLQERSLKVLTDPLFSGNNQSHKRTVQTTFPEADTDVLPPSIEEIMAKGLPLLTESLLVPKKCSIEPSKGAEDGQRMFQGKITPLHEASSLRKQTRTGRKTECLQSDLNWSKMACSNDSIERHNTRVLGSIIDGSATVTRSRGEEHSVKMAVSSLQSQKSIRDPVHISNSAISKLSDPEYCVSKLYLSSTNEPSGAKSPVSRTSDATSAKVQVFRTKDISSSKATVPMTSDTSSATVPKSRTSNTSSATVPKSRTSGTYSAKVSKSRTSGTSSFKVPISRTSDKSDTKLPVSKITKPSGAKVPDCRTSSLPKGPTLSAVHKKDRMHTVTSKHKPKTVESSPSSAQHSHVVYDATHVLNSFSGRHAKYFSTDTPNVQPHSKDTVSCMRSKPPTLSVKKRSGSPAYDAECPEYFNAKKKRGNHKIKGSGDPKLNSSLVQISHSPRVQSDTSGFSKVLKKLNITSSNEHFLCQIAAGQRSLTNKKLRKKSYHESLKVRQGKQRQAAPSRTNSASADQKSSSSLRIQGNKNRNPISLSSKKPNSLLGSKLFHNKDSTSLIGKHVKFSQNSLKANVSHNSVCEQLVNTSSRKSPSQQISVKKNIRFTTLDSIDKSRMSSFSMDALTPCGTLRKKVQAPTVFQSEEKNASLSGYSNSLTQMSSITSTTLIREREKERCQATVHQFQNIPVHFSPPAHVSSHRSTDDININKSVCRKNFFKPERSFSEDFSESKMFQPGSQNINKNICAKEMAVFDQEDTLARLTSIPSEVHSSFQQCTPTLQEFQQQNRRPSTKNNACASANSAEPGENLLKRDDLISAVLQWSPSWLEEYKDAGLNTFDALPPIVDKGQLFPLVDSYEDLADYQHMTFNLLLVDVFEEIFCTWKERRKNPPLCRVCINQEISVPNYASGKNSALVFSCRGLLSREQIHECQYPMEGDIVILSMCGLPLSDTADPDIKPNTCYSRASVWTQQLAYVEKMQCQPCYDIQKLLAKNPLLVDHPSLKTSEVFIMDLILKIHNLKCVPAPQELITLNSIGSIAKSIRQFDALVHIQKSRLLRDILKPTRSAFCDSCQATNKSVLKDAKISFNERQSQAIHRIANAVQQPWLVPRICMLYGPPGTGKSQIVVGAILRILQDSNNDAKICLAAASTTAVDELLRQLHKKKKEHGLKFSILRIGRSESSHFDVKPFLWEQKVNRAKQEELHLKKLQNVPKSIQRAYEDLSRKMKDTKKKLEEFSSCRNAWETEKWTQKHLQQKKEWDVLHASISSFQQNLKLSPEESMHIYEQELHKASVICGTLNSFGSPRITSILGRGQSHFSCAIIDEATQATELDCLIPLQFDLSKLVLVGDPNQLSPTVTSVKARSLKYGVSLFERLYNYIQNNSKIMGENPIIILNTQYRMNPHICCFPKYHMYQGLLETDRQQAENSQKFPLQPYFVFDVDCKNISSQSCIKAEIEFPAVLCQHLLNFGFNIQPNSIGIICLDNTPKRLLITKLRNNGIKDVEVNSLDVFQGREKHIIILSCVNGQSSSGNIGFLADRKKMNVALTRAKYALYIIGDLQSLTADRDWKALIRNAEERHVVEHVPSLDDFPAIIKHRCVKPQLITPSTHSAPVNASSQECRQSVIRISL